MPNIRHNIIVEARPEKVYEALTRSDLLTRWWTEDAKAEPEVGSICRFRFGGGAVEVTMRIEHLSPYHVRWHCLEGIQEWEGTNVFFLLRAGGKNATLIDFGHTGWETEDGGLPTCSYDWAHYLRSLKLLLETGEGIPHPEYLSRGQIR